MVQCWKDWFCHLRSKTPVTELTSSPHLLPRLDVFLSSPFLWSFFFCCCCCTLRHVNATSCAAMCLHTHKKKTHTYIHTHISTHTHNKLQQTSVVTRDELDKLVPRYVDNLPSASCFRFSFSNPADRSPSACPASTFFFFLSLVFFFFCHLPCVSTIISFFF